MNRNYIWLAMAVAAGLAGLIVWRYMQIPVQPAFNRVTGTITYREQIVLPPGSRAAIEIVDISQADAPAGTIAAQIVDDPVSVPISFSLDYRLSDIDERSRYAVQAAITIDGQLAFINDTVYPVITHGAGNTVHLTLARVQRPTDFPSDKLSAAEKLIARRDTLMRMDGTLLTGEASITYSAWRDDNEGGDIVLIEETREMGIYGNALVTIYYSGGRPFLYSETGQRRSESEDTEEHLQDVYVIFEFDEEGNVLTNSKVVDGISSTPDDAEITGAYDHARFLIEESRLLTEASSSRETADYRCQGNEPFWTATIKGNTLNLKQLGHDEKTWIGDHTPLPSHQGDRFEWQSDNGNRSIPEIVVTLIQEECKDTMSDESFPFSSSVQHSTGKILYGCCHNLTPKSHN